MTPITYILVYVKINHSPLMIFFFPDIFSVCFILDSFYWYAFKFANLFFNSVYLWLIPPSVFFHLNTLVFISRICFWSSLFYLPGPLFKLFNLSSSSGIYNYSLHVEHNPPPILEIKLYSSIQKCPLVYTLSEAAFVLQQS